MTVEEFEIQVNQSVTITPQTVANRLHQQMYGDETEHSVIHSCPCYYLALFYLGLTKTTGMYWPDQKGDNQWKA